jgi:site-specific recombinase XerD
LREDAVTALRDWIAERGGRPEDPLFPNRHNRPLSRDSIEHLVRKYGVVAGCHCPSLAQKHITPHVLRHSAAMALLQNGVDRAVIALWLGHESVETTQIYLHADMRMKEQALAKTANVDVTPGRYRPDDELLAFLKRL